MAAPFADEATSSVQVLDYLLIIDFEATCIDSNSTGKRLYPQEIIELPMVLVDTRTAKVVAEFQRYITPVVHPTLSTFCTNLTGITQSMVSAETGAVSFRQAWKDAESFLVENHLIRGTKTFRAVTCGDWDLMTMLPQQLKTTFGPKAKVPAHFSSWINVKSAVAQFYQPHRRVGGMVDMLSYLNIKLQGRHHSGIDDSRNIAAICQRMLRDECVFGDVIKPRHVVSATTNSVAKTPSRATSSIADSSSSGQTVLQMALLKAMEKKAASRAAAAAAATRTQH